MSTRPGILAIFDDIYKRGFLFVFCEHVCSAFSSSSRSSNRSIGRLEFEGERSLSLRTTFFRSLDATEARKCVPVWNYGYLHPIMVFKFAINDVSRFELSLLRLYVMWIYQNTYVSERCMCANRHLFNGKFSVRSVGMYVCVFAQCFVRMAVWLGNPAEVNWFR